MYYICTTYVEFRNTKYICGTYVPHMYNYELYNTYAVHMYCICIIMNYIVHMHHICTTYVLNNFVTYIPTQRRYIRHLLYFANTCHHFAIHAANQWLCVYLLLCASFCILNSEYAYIVILFVATMHIFILLSL